MSDNVIFLEFRSPHVAEGQRGLMSCKNCSNKTYLMVMDKVGEFPLCQCAACGQHIGRMGWSHDDA